MRQDTKIFVVDDDADVREALERTLRPFYFVTCFGSITETINALQTEKPDLIIADLSLPDGDGWDLLEQAKTLTPDSVRIVLSGTTEIEKLKEKVRGGLAHRFFLKPWDTAVFLLQMEEALNYRETLKMNRKLQVEARTDTMTGLLNRRAFDEIFFMEVDRATRHQRNLSLIIVDVDGFKGVNDSSGHSAGDIALCQVASQLRQNVRSIDFVARVGGDEFAVILPDTDKLRATTAAERIRRTTQGPTLSLGLSCLPDDGITAPEIWNAADQRLLRAKQAGKNKTIVD